MDFKKDWFNNDLVVGAFPYRQNDRFNVDDYSVVINMSDEWYSDIEQMIKERYVSYYWFPMNECKFDIGTNSIFAAMNILWHCEKRNLRVYLHCHAGINRSQTTKCAYYYMRTGEHLELRGRRNPLVMNCNYGYLPPLNEMNEMLKKLSERMEEYNKGGIFDSVKLKISSQV